MKPAASARLCRSRGPRLARLHRAQHARQAAGADRARRALAARLALEERRERRGDRQRAGRPPDHQDRGGAERRSRRPQRVRVERRVRLRGRERRRRRSGGEDHADAVGRAAALLARSTRASGVPSAHLVHARPAHVAPQRDERRLARAVRVGIVERRRQRATASRRSARASAGRAGRPRRAAAASAAARRAGPPAPPAPRSPRRRRSVSSPRRMRDGEPAGERRAQARRRARERALQVDDGLGARPAGPRPRREARQHLRRAPPHHEAVLDRARLALGPVGDHGGRRRPRPAPPATCGRWGTSRRRGPAGRRRRGARRRHAAGERVSGAEVAMGARHSTAPLLCCTMEVEAACGVRARTTRPPKERYPK